MTMDAKDAHEALVARRRCVLRRPVDVVDLTISIDGLTETHWRRLVLPTGWSLRGTAKLLLSAFNRVEHEVVWFEAGGIRRYAAPNPIEPRESRISHLAGDDEPTFLEFLREAVLAAPVRSEPLNVSFVDAEPLPGAPRPIRGDEPWFAARAWRHSIVVHEHRSEPGSEPIPRCAAAAGCDEDAAGLCNAEFIERLRRWRNGKRARDSYDRFFREDVGDPDRTDIALVEWNLMGLAAPVWKRAQRTTDSPLEGS